MACEGRGEGGALRSSFPGTRVEGANAGGLFLPDVCSCCVSRNASVNVARRELIVACRNLPITFCVSNFWGIPILKKLNTEMRVYRTKIDNVTFIL